MLWLTSDHLAGMNDCNHCPNVLMKTQIEEYEADHCLELLVTLNLRLCMPSTYFLAIICNTLAMLPW